MKTAPIITDNKAQQALFAYDWNLWHSAAALIHPNMINSVRETLERRMYDAKANWPDHQHHFAILTDNPLLQNDLQLWHHCKKVLPRLDHPDYRIALVLRMDGIRAAWPDHQHLFT